MKNNRLGRTNCEVAEIGLGTWQLGSDCWGDMNRQKAFGILEAAAANGVGFFDTADVYGAGHSESLLGEFFSAHALKSVVATKIGRWASPGWPGNFQRDWMLRHIEASAKRLRTDALDLVQLHCIPTAELVNGAVFKTLREAKDAGLIRHFGASVESADEGIVAIDHGAATLQIIFNIFRQKPAERLLGYAQEKGVGIIVRLPLASGLLSGKFSATTTFAANDHRNFNRNGELFNVGETFAGLEYLRAVELSDALKSYVPASMTMSQMALRWILDFDAVSVIIPGATSIEQVVVNVSSAAVPPLSEALHEELSRFYTTHVAAHIRGPN